MKELTLSILRWIYTAWRLFWQGVLIAATIAIIVIGGALAIVQLDATQNFLTNRIEDQFNSTFNGRLSIGDLDGVVPLTLVMQDLSVVYEDSTQNVDSVLTISELQVGINWPGLLRRRIAVNNLQLIKPDIDLHGEQGNQGIFKRAFERRNPDQARNESEWMVWLRENYLDRIEILAPVVKVEDGSIRFHNNAIQHSRFRLPPAIRLQDINLVSFVELNREQRFVDIEQFGMAVPDLLLDSVAVSGQIFNDERFLEFNGLRLQTSDSRMSLSAEVDGFNMLRKQWATQLRTARYDANLDSVSVRLSEFADIFPRLPILSQPLELHVDGEGTIDSVMVNKFALAYNRSYLEGWGTVNNLREPGQQSYLLELDRSRLASDDLETLSAYQGDGTIQFDQLFAEGTLQGTGNQLSGDVEARVASDTLRTQFDLSMRDTLRFRMQAESPSFDLASLTDLEAENSRLGFSLKAEGRGRTPETLKADIDLAIKDSRLGGLPMDQASFEGSINEGFAEGGFTIINGLNRLQGEGWVDLLSSEPVISLEGEADGINLARYFTYKDVPTTDIAFRYRAQLQGFEPDRMYGSANLDIERSVFDQDTVRAHQLYVDLNEPSNRRRELRFTSSLLDAEVNWLGRPSAMVGLGKHWSNYVTSRVREEILLRPDSTQYDRPAHPSIAADTVSAVVSAEIKDLKLLKRYLPSIGQIGSALQVDAEITADAQRMLVSSEVKDDSLTIRDFTATNVDTRLTAGLRYGQSFKQFSSIDIRSQADQVKLNKLAMDTLYVDLSLKNDSLHYTQFISRIGKDVTFNNELNARLSDSTITLTVEEFFLGNNRYGWQDEGRPRLVYRADHALVVDSVRLSNIGQRILLNGTYSNNPTDSVTYELDGIELERISELIDGRITFQGKLDGSFFTRTLASQPVVAGDFLVDELRMDERLVGDILFSSAFNPQKERFDTDISIITDSLKYPEYMADNNGVGQKIFINGYFYPPDPTAEQDTVFYFDLDLEEIDMWILPFIVKNVFKSVEGVADGKGYITGNLEEIDFHGEFMADSAYAHTNFLNTRYTLKGPIVVDYEEGVNLDSLEVRGEDGGSGILYGTLDFNQLQPVKYLDFWLELDDLAFLNTDFDRELPFYGDAWGSGKIHLYGPNIAPTLETTDPIILNSKSSIGVPLLEEIEFEEDTKFIRFVSDFENIRGRAKRKVSDGLNRNGEPGQGEIVLPEEQEFTELFDLNLRFQAPRNITGELIFDPITGEILTAQGRGQLSITLEDEELEMFGRYEIQSGSYLFVSGDIFTRRFTLEQGGTVQWQGDPENASLAINAVYRARPDISGLLSGAQTTNPDDVQRVPVELVLEITGSIENVRNDFFFRIPNTIDLSQNSRVSNLDTRLNNDDNKLLQATSFLLTGELIPIAFNTSQDATGALSSNIRNRSGSLVLNPLLSNQINRLLNSNISNFDIDLNLVGFDQVDLGIALRLFNDRLILSREGQITGNQSNIGDLGATYRLTNSLSVMAFHRQDPTFNTVTSGNDAGQATQSLNGLGLEAQFQFNHWSDLTNSMRQTFRNIFGISSARIEVEEESDEDKNLASGKRN